MKQLLLYCTFCLLLIGQLSAQPPGNDKSRQSGNARMRTTLAFQLESKQKDLGSLLDAYSFASQASKSELRQQIRKNLYEQFDLGIRQKEAEIANLETQLRQLKKSEAYEQKSGEIQQLQNSLQRIQVSLDFRKDNREKIVEKRLKELLEG
ncbi:MAG: hypothetical protein AAFQ87_17960 [Bacteroidota bacterium]